MDKFEKLDGPPIEEGSCLLRSYSLQEIPRSDTDVVIFHYDVDPNRKVTGSKYSNSPAERLEQGDSTSFVDTSEEQSGEFLILDDRRKLYMKNEEKTVINPIYFHPKDTSVLVIDFVGCDTVEAKSFITTVSTSLALPKPSTLQDPSTRSQGTSIRITPQGSDTTPPFPGGPSVFDAESLENHDHFITGISLRAADELREFLTLFVSIPYLGVGSNPTLDGSRTLSQYRLQNPPGAEVSNDPKVNETPVNEIPEFNEKPANENPEVNDPHKDSQVLVHQIWFLVFNNETIGVFRSENDKHRHRTPLFPYQKRGGAFIALVNMIANTLTSSEKEALKILRRQIIQLESGEEPVTHADDSRREEQLRREHQFGVFITQVFTIMRLVRSQIEYLENLLHIFQTSYGTKMKCRPQSNLYDIPFMHSKNEQMQFVVQQIEILIIEREKFYRELRTWVKELEHSRSLFVQGDQVESQKSIITSLEKQGQTISVFTLITSVFLPLGFLSSYYAMSPKDFTSSTIKTTRQFWIISAPVTGALFLCLSLFLFNQDDGIKDRIRGRYNTQKGKLMAKNKKTGPETSVV